jgi:hypothetical protein
MLKAVFAQLVNGGIVYRTQPTRPRQGMALPSHGRQSLNTGSPAAVRFEADYRVRATKDMVLTRDQKRGAIFYPLSSKRPRIPTRGEVKGYRSTYAERLD